MTSWCPGRGSRGPVPLTGADGQLEGPFNAMLFAPGTGAPLLALGTAVRFGSGLTPRAREIATLAVAAHSGSAYELYAHERLGRQAGLTAAECAALRDQQDPGLADPAEQAVLRVTSALLAGGDIPDDLYHAAEQAGPRRSCRARHAGRLLPHPGHDHAHVPGWSRRATPGRPPVTAAGSRPPPAMVIVVGPGRTAGRVWPAARLRTE